MAGESNRAAVYARISSDRDGEALGVERQLQDCRKICKANGWTAAEYTDNNLSASKRDVVRPEYNRLLEDIKSGQIDVVVVWDLDRLTRRPLEFENFVEVCEMSGMTHDIHTVSGPKSQLELRMRAALAAEEAKKISQRVTRKKVELAQAGKPHGGSRAFGFEKDGITHNEPEAELIREAATRILQDESLHAIRRDWEARGVKTATGKDRWSVSSLKRSLVTPKVAGLRVYQGEVLDGVETQWQPILDRETWESVCAILNDPARFTGIRTGNYPLNGLLWCALCREPLKAMPRQGTRCYGCKKDTGGCGRIHVRSEKIEDYLFNVLLPMADSPGMRNVLRAEGEGGDKRTQELRVAKAQDKKMLDQLVTDYADQLIDRQMLRKQSDRLQRRIEAIDAQLSTSLANTALTKLGGEIQSSWETLSPEDKRLVLASIAKRIEVGPAPTPGSNRFDPARIKIQLRSEAIEKIFVGPLELTRYVL